MQYIIPEIIIYLIDQGQIFEFPVLEWREFFDIFKNKQLFEGDWFDMHESWVPHLKDPNVLWLEFNFNYMFCLHSLITIII